MSIHQTNSPEAQGKIDLWRKRSRRAQACLVAPRETGKPTREGGKPPRGEMAPIYHEGHLLNAECGVLQDDIFEVQVGAHSHCRNAVITLLEHISKGRYQEKGKTVYILVVDDDHFANTLVQFVLTKEGYEVETTENPRWAMQMIQRREPDLLILDVTMPYLNGFDFSRKLREEGYEIPLIFMTAQDTIEAKLQGFDIGADDYICKPYNHQELVARVQAVLRRIKKHNRIGNQSIRKGKFELFPAELKVINGHTSINLTRTEMQVLRVLMDNSGRVVNRDLLLTEVWNDEENSSNIVDVYIRRLRSKLEADPNKPEYIISVRGVGYKFVGK